MFREALRLQPDYAAAWNNLGLAYGNAGDPQRALECFRRAVAADPALVLAAVNLAIALAQTGSSNEALQSYDRALAMAPQTLVAWVGRGALLADSGRFEAALHSFEAALRIDPTDASVLVQQAMVLLALERAQQACECAEAALRVNFSAAACNAHAGALRKLGRFSEALRSLEQAVELDPDFVDGWRNLSTVLHELGEDDRAVQACRKALELNPDDIQSRTRLLARLIPAVPLTEHAVIEARARFDDQLVQFEDWLHTKALSHSDALIASQQQFFYLSYQEISNLRSLRRYRTACAARLAIVDGVVPRRAHVAADRADQRFRLGFVSAHVFDHSVFHAILCGWLEFLDQDRFSISLFSLGSKQDASTNAASTSVEHFVSGARTVGDWVREIRNRDFDALVFPELGMNEPTLALASMRLASRQFAAWGHPETSGLPTIDDFLSSELLEPPGAQDHYSEQLCRLPNLGVYCRPYAVLPVPLDFDGLAITNNGPVFICPGVPFKYRPADDWIFVEIARRLGHCTFVFFQHEMAQLSRKLQGRIADAFATGGLDSKRHVRLIPWQSRAAFFALLQQADVYLDTIGFSGFNTLMQAVECRLPCVAYEGKFLRGRLGSGILRRMGMQKYIAHSDAGYMSIWRCASARARPLEPSAANI